MPLYRQPREEHHALFLEQGVLLVTRNPVQPPKPAPRQLGILTDYQQPYLDILMAMGVDGRVRVFCGHVDLGTGVRTALAQMVADELDVSFEHVCVELGHTAATPDQGPTVASATIQVTSASLRRAAAIAREYLVKEAASAWQCEAAVLETRDGAVHGASDRRLAYSRIIDGRHVELPLRDDIALKPATRHRIIGTAAKRVDIPDKAMGNEIYVHDIRVAGMWHGKVVRPPYTGRDSGDFVGKSLMGVDDAAARALSDRIEIVTLGDFVGVVAPTEPLATAAAKALVVTWREPDPLPRLDDVDVALAALPYRERVLNEVGDIDTDESVIRINRLYTWPYHMHGSIGPSCAVADYGVQRTRVWSGTQNPHWLRADLSRLTGQEEGSIDVIRLEAAGCYGRNCADDVAADALLLSRAVGRPVRVQLSREQEHGWEPKGAAQRMQVQASINAGGHPCSYAFQVRYPANDAPNLALLFTGVQSAEPRMLELGDRTAIPPYAYPNQRIVCHDVAPIVRASWLRGVSALPTSFAHDCVIDELAEAAGQDPVAYRIRHLPDERARDLIQETARRAKWMERERGSRGQPDAHGFLHGSGVAYARYVHSKFPGFPSAWACWVLDLSVEASTGVVQINRVVVGQDTGMIVNPAGVRHQIHGNVIQSLSRVLREAVHFDERGVVDLEWGSYPIHDFTDIPNIEIVLMDRQNEPPLGSGESSSVPSAAAVANALYDATGIRFRDVPFTPERIKVAMQTARSNQSRLPIPIS